MCQIRGVRARAPKCVGASSQRARASHRRTREHADAQRRAAAEREQSCRATAGRRICPGCSAPLHAAALRCAVLCEPSLSLPRRNGVFCSKSQSPCELCHHRVCVVLQQDSRTLHALTREAEERICACRCASQASASCRSGRASMPGLVSGSSLIATVK